MFRNCYSLTSINLENFELLNTRNMISTFENCRKYLSEEELELEFRNQIRLFQQCFFYDKEHGGFRYPDNLSKNDIIEDIKKWMKYAEMGGRDILYQTYEQLSH